MTCDQAKAALAAGRVLVQIGRIDAPTVRALDSLAAACRRAGVNFTQ